MPSKPIPEKQIENEILRWLSINGIFAWKNQSVGIHGVMDRAHIKTMKTGGTWDEFNIVLLCRMHHQESHNLGWVRFIGKYKHTYKEFRSKGWHLQDVLGITKLIRYSK